jgi:hypothetical protein
MPWPSRLALHAFGVRDLIPIIAIPLASGDTEPHLDLGSLLVEIYDAARFDLRVDYTSDPVPPLGGDDSRGGRA